MREETVADFSVRLNERRNPISIAGTLSNRHNAAVPVLTDSGTEIPHRSTAPMDNTGSTLGTSPVKKKYFVVSADCHVHEPLDLWERRIEPKFRHRIPRLETDENGKRWLVFEGMRRTRVRDVAFEGEDRERAQAGRADLSIRMRDLERDGIDAEVIYPNRGLMMWASP